MMQRRIGTWYERYQKAQAWRENNGLPGQAVLKQKLEKKSSRPPASGKRAVAQEVAA